MFVSAFLLLSRCPTTLWHGINLVFILNLNDPTNASVDTAMCDSCVTHVGLRSSWNSLPLVDNWHAAAVHDVLGCILMQTAVV